MPHVCYVVHALPPAEHTGTPLVAWGYARALAARGWTVTVVSGTGPTETTWAAPITAVDPAEGFERVGVPITPYHGVRWAVHAASVRADHTPAAAGFARILRQRRVDVVHVVDNVNLPLELADVAQAKGIPVVRTVSCAEDLCGLVAPVSPCSGPAGYCEPPLTPAQCAACVSAAAPELLRADPRDVAAEDAEAETTWRRQELRDDLARKRARTVDQYSRVFDRIVFSNAAWRRYFEATLPLDQVRARTIAMGIDPPAGFDRTGPVRVPGPAEPVVLGVVGTLDRVKGADALLAAFSSPELVGRDDYRLRCIGGGDPTVLDALAAANPHVERHGRYTTDELPELLAGLHVGLSPSYFETFHRVTREYLLAGRPVVASRALGILDVIRPGVNGLLFDHAEPGAFVAAIRRVLDDRELLARLAAGAAATPIRTVDEEVDDLAALYEELLVPVSGRDPLAMLPR